MKLEAINTNGKWTVNGKSIPDLNPIEQRFLEDLITQYKQELKPEKEHKPLPDWEKLLNDKKYGKL